MPFSLSLFFPLFYGTENEEWNEREEEKKNEYSHAEENLSLKFVQSIDRIKENLPTFQK